jgi:hypothetical protein
VVKVSLHASKLGNNVLAERIGHSNMMASNVQIHERTSKAKKSEIETGRSGSANQLFS